MNTDFDDIARQARALHLTEKAALARLLIEDLDPAVDVDVDQLWIDGAYRRYDSFLKGELGALSGDEVMNRVRNRLLKSGAA